MKTGQFPTKKFHEVIQGKKLKTNLKPFIEQYQAQNLPWMFESISILADNLGSSEVQAKTKLASAYVAKNMIENGQYILISLIEAYLLPYFKKAALYDPEAQQQIRGDTLFITDEKRGDEQLMKLGYNYVRICLEIILIGSMLKPKKLYDFEQVKDFSSFTLAKKEVLKALKVKPQTFMIIKQPNDIKKNYQAKLQKFDDNNIENYCGFIEGLFLQQLKNSFSSKKQLDIRPLLCQGENCIIDVTLDLCQQALQKTTQCSVISSVLQYINMIYKTGNMRVLAILHNNKEIRSLIKQILDIPGNNKQLTRGENFLKKCKGSPQQKKAIYIQFLRKLQFWVKTEAGRNIRNPQNPSGLVYFYELLKKQRQYTFPQNPLLKKEIAQFQQNKKLFENMNKNFIKQIISQLPQQKNDGLVSNVNVPKNWSLVSDSPRSVKQQQSKKSINNIAVQPIKQISASKQMSKEISRQVKQINHQILKQPPPKKQSQKKMKQQSVSSTPMPPPGQVTYESLQTTLNIIHATICSMHLDTTMLQNDLNNISRESSSLEGLFEYAEGLSEEQVEQLMGIHFDTSDCIQDIKKHIIQFQKGRIDYTQFCKEMQNTRKRYNIQANANDLKFVTRRRQIQKQAILQKKQREQQQIHINKKTSSKNVILIDNLKLLQDRNKQDGNKQEKDKKVSQNNIQNKPKQHVQLQKPNALKSVSSIKPSLKDQIASNKNLSSNQNSHTNLQGRVQMTPQKIKQQHKSIQKLETPKSYKYHASIEQIKVSKTQQYHSINKQQFILPEQQKVEFQNSSLGVQSQNNLNFSPSQQQRKKPGEILENLSMQVSEIKEEVIDIDCEEVRPHFMKKMNINQNGRNMNNVIYTPIVSQRQKKVNGSHIKLQSPFIKKNQQRMILQDLEVDQPFKNQIQQQLQEDQIIQSPDLLPLQTSFHHISQRNIPKKALKSFKDAIDGQKNSNNRFGKKQKMFWLKSETQSIMKPANAANNQRSRVTSKINVPDILEERSKKHEQQIKLLESDRDRKVRELKQRLNQVQREKSSISIKLKQKQQQVRTLKEQSDNSKLSVNQQQINYIDDQNYYIKKMNAGNSFSRRRDDNISIDRNKSYSVLKNEGTLINTKPYHRYFTAFTTQKQKKMHLKNKQLLHKDRNIEIGCMGYLQGDTYKIACYITPQKDIILDKIGIENDDNLSIKSQFDRDLYIGARKQQKVFFLVNVKNIPYEIPYVYFYYKIDGSYQKIRIFLPVGLHKFFKISDVRDEVLDQSFNAHSILRGQEIPYSKRALKNVDNLQDYLPHIKKLRNGDTNNLGEIVFGGQAHYRDFKFLIRICVKPNQFLYVQIVNHTQDQRQDMKKIIQFYLATVNHFLMKDINWN